MVDADDRYVSEGDEIEVIPPEEEKKEEGDVKTSSPQVKPSPFRKRLSLFVTKDLSYLDETAGGAVIPPPEHKDGPPEATELERAKHSDLITLPDGIEGTNCFNCRYIHATPHNEEGYRACIHPEVDQPVTERMCCKYWDQVGAKRTWLPEGGELQEQPGEKAMRKPKGNNLKPRPTGSDRLVRIKATKYELAGKYVDTVVDPFGIVKPSSSRESSPVRSLDAAFEMIQLHKRKGDHYGLWAEEISDQEYNDRGFKSLPDSKKNVSGFLTKATGTCKPGQRSDLTGCQPAEGEAGSPQSKKKEEGKRGEVGSERDSIHSG